MNGIEVNHLCFDAFSSFLLCRRLDKCIVIYNCLQQSPCSTLHCTKSKLAYLSRSLAATCSWTGAALVPTVYQQKSRKGRRAFPSLWKRGIDGFKVLSIFLSSYQRVFHYWSSLRVPFEPFNPSSTVHRELHWI